MKDQIGGKELRGAILAKLAQKHPASVEDQARELAAITLALEAGARLGWSGEELRQLLAASVGPDQDDEPSDDLLADARRVIRDPGSAGGVWKEALAVIQPLGMDLAEHPGNLDA